MSNTRLKNRTFRTTWLSNGTEGKNGGAVPEGTQDRALWSVPQRLKNTGACHAAAVYDGSSRDLDRLRQPGRHLSPRPALYARPRPEMARQVRPPLSEVAARARSGQRKAAQYRRTPRVSFFYRPRCRGRGSDR